MAGERLSAFEYFDAPVYHMLRQLTQQDPESRNFTTEKALREIHCLVVEEVAANKAKKPEELSPPGELLGQLPYMIAESLIEIAVCTRPSSQGRLVEFASQLYRQTELDPDSGEQLTYDNLPLWTRDLTLMYSLNRKWRDWEAPESIEKCMFRVSCICSSVS